MLILAERLKELRKQKGVTQKFVADLLGIRESSYQVFEYGKHIPKRTNLIKLADFYNVSVDYLLGIDELPPDWESPQKKESTAKDELIRLIDSVPEEKYEKFSVLLRSAIDAIK